MFKLGDMVQLQIVYPIVPPMPTGAVILTHSPIVSAVGVFSSSPVGKVGVGYLNAFVKIVGLGYGHFTVHVCYGDGSAKNVPFAFQSNL